MLPLVEDYYSSGLSQKKYCEREQLDLNFLRYWLCQYKVHPIDKISELISSLLSKVSGKGVV